MEGCASHATYNPLLALGALTSRVKANEGLSCTHTLSQAPPPQGDDGQSATTGAPSMENRVSEMPTVLTLALRMSLSEAAEEEEARFQTDFERVTVCLTFLFGHLRM